MAEREGIETLFASTAPLLSDYFAKLKPESPLNRQPGETPLVINVDSAICRIPDDDIDSISLSALHGQGSLEVVDSVLASHPKCEAMLIGRTRTPAVRAEIAASHETASARAQRFGITDADDLQVQEA